ncbi:MFS transporter [Candidatus Micrarchaeota archaeon]|nr:MFS transporter [Candidatus Micrarchaeota archaeon]
MRRLELINVIYTLIASILAVLLPLYLLEQNFDLGSIGFIVSIGPLMFIFLRVILASIADSMGTKKVDLFYSISNLFSIIAYYFAATPVLYTLGSLLEGFRNSGFWSVVRTEALTENSGEKITQTLVYYSNLRQITEGLGKIVAGFMIAVVGFANSFAAVFVLSLFLLGLNLSGEEQTSKSRVNFSSSDVLKRIMKTRPNSFWYGAFLQMLLWLPYNVTAVFLLPLYLNDGLKFSYQDTGFYVAFYLLGIGLVAALARKMKLKLNFLYLITALIVIGYFLLGFRDLFLPSFILIVIGTGALNILAEYILADQILRSNDVSTDIGLTYVPLKIVEFATYFFGGFLIAWFGYVPLFLVCGFSIMVFLFFSRKIIFESKFNL